MAIGDVVPDEILVQDLYYSYPPLAEGAEPVTVLRGIDFRIPRGQFVTVLGRAGAGKTTLCMALNGLVPQATGGVFRGSVHVLGLDTRRHPVAELAQRVGMVFQDPEMQLVQMRVEDEIAFGLENLGVPAPEIEKRISWALNVVGLAGFRDRSPIGLSGGQKQRVAIAAMLAMQPRVLVLDEPTASLDPAGKAAIFDVLAALRARRDITIVMATQELDWIRRYADRILALHDGQVALDDSPRRAFAQVPRLQELGIGVPELAELSYELAERTGRRYVFTGRGTGSVASRRQAGESWVRRRRQAPVTPRVPPALSPDTPAGAVQISVENVSYTYEDGTVALNGVDLAVRPGEFIALLGPNGAGKSTLARHLNGLLRPSSGRVQVEGRSTRQVTVPVLARAVGYAFQNPDHQIFASSVAEEIAFGLRNQQLPEATIALRTAQVLEQFGLSRYARTPPAMLGFGERRKVALASVLAVQPAVLVLDEPTGGLDWRSQVEFMELVAEFNGAGHAILMITHDMRLVAEYARRAIVLFQGRVLFDGAVPALFDRPDIIRQARLTLPPVAGLARRLRPAGLSPDALTVEGFTTAWASRLAARGLPRRMARREDQKTSDAAAI